MNAAHRTVVSVMDIGGTHVTAANVDLDTRAIVAGQSFREPLDSDADADEIVNTLILCASRLPTHANRWSIALPGPFDYEHGIGRYERVGKFDSLRGYDLRAALTRLLLGGADLSFHNDAAAFGLGEWWAGAARGHRRVVGITLRTGVGSCFLRDGSVLRRGFGIPPDGRIDLLSYAGKPLEETVSRRAIRRAYAQATGELPTPDVRKIAQRARHGDRAAAAIFAGTFHALGTVLGPCLDAFKPTMLVVGGSIAASWDLVAEPLRARLADTPSARTRRIALERALHPAEAPLLGAAYLASTAPHAHPSPRPREKSIP